MPTHLWGLKQDKSPFERLTGDGKAGEMQCQDS